MRTGHRKTTIRRIIKKTQEQTYLDGYDTSIIMQAFLISEDGYIINTGNWENVNAEMIRLLYDKIQKHPWLWKKFFMVG